MSNGRPWTQLFRCMETIHYNYTYIAAYKDAAIASHKMYVRVAVPGMALIKANTIGSVLTITPSSSCTHTSGLGSPSVKV